jgi:hypothetical protein
VGKGHKQCSHSAHKLRHSAPRRCLWVCEPTHKTWTHPRLHAREAVCVFARQQLLPFLTTVQRPLYRLHKQARSKKCRESLPAAKCSAVHSARIGRRLRQQSRQQQATSVKHLPVPCPRSHIRQHRGGGQRQLSGNGRGQCLESLQCGSSCVVSAQALNHCVAGHHLASSSSLRIRWVPCRRRQHNTNVLLRIRWVPCRRRLRRAGGRARAAPPRRAAGASGARDPRGRSE